jgi:hypothetical protein
VETRSRAKASSAQQQPLQALWRQSQEAIGTSAELLEAFALLVEETALTLEETALLKGESQQLRGKGSGAIGGFNLRHLLGKDIKPLG